MNEVGTPPAAAPAPLPGRTGRVLLARRGPWWVLASTLGAVLLSVVIGSAVLLVAGFSPLTAYGALLAGAFGGPFAIAETLTRMTPLIFTGLAVAFAFQAGLFNIGAEGQLVIGALAAAMVGQFPLGLPLVIHLSLALLAGALGGAVWAALAGIIKARFDAHEVIVTIMLNYVALLLTSYLVNYPWKAEGMVPQTVPIQASATLPRLLQGSQLSAGLFLGLLCAAAAWFILRHTLLGYEVRAVGLNPPAAATAGIHANRTLVLAMAIAGVFAGLGGAVEVLGVHERFIQGFSPGYGYDGIAVAVLASNSPLGLLPTAFLFGALRSGAAGMGRTTDVPADFAVLIQGLIIVFAGAPYLFRILFGGRR